MASGGLLRLDPETIRLILEGTTPLVYPELKFRQFCAPCTPYKLMDVFHFDDCGCDECGAYARVGIG